MAIKAINKGSATIVRPWKPNSSTTVSSSPTTETGLRAAVNASTSPPLRTSARRVRAPAIKGTTT